MACPVDTSIVVEGTGATLFFGCLLHESKTVGDAARDIGRITLLGAAPLIIPLTISLAYRQDYNIPGGLASISHGTTVILLFVYLPWIYFRRVTHRERFSAEDTSGALLGSRLTHARHVRISTRALLFYVFIAMASFTTNIFVARYVVRSIDPLIAATSLSSDFLSIIIIPLAINCSNYVKATLLAHSGDDVSLSVYVTFGAAVGNVLFSLPLLLIIAWGTARPLLMDLPGAQVFTLVGSIWETFIVLGTGRVNYLNGLTCLCLCVTPHPHNAASTRPPS
jgi:Ca2+:H+ antiporter